MAGGLAPQRRKSVAEPTGGVETSLARRCLGAVRAGGAAGSGAAEGRIARRVAGRTTARGAPEQLRRLDSEDRRQAEEVLVALMSGEKVSYKHLDELPVRTARPGSRPRGRDLRGARSGEMGGSNAGRVLRRNPRYSNRGFRPPGRPVRNHRTREVEADLPKPQGPEGTKRGILCPQRQ